ncbi:thiamine phosphate synthase [Azospirillum doebereinerae]|uniref:Thiamine-phosphate synthase n=1 Tax=Azospirillum doebereinerae TaxID=92933 RepID=A0A3S1CGR8_9PROT|nr:thiamine phosphate synthase [Azospirillum doebereinerae]MCG5240369.1 thiamine phosphate synthase [Azospirillum doebereinerae]RUQ70239.1 thiamine phosphate synthase [Azospirillum doebereinerae]
MAKGKPSQAEPSACRLYLVTPPALVPAAFAPLLVEALDAGDVACVQLRLKDCSDDEIRRACDALRPIAQEREVAFILNDHPRLAREMGCDGVHVGQGDTPYRDARKIMGNDAIVGVTCHDSRHLAMVAAEDGADYVAFGAFFPTDTKLTEHHAAPELLNWWSELMEVPCVAIGGITAANCAPLVSAGADFLAVVNAVWGHPGGPGAGVKALNAAIAAAPSDWVIDTASDAATIAADDATSTPDGSDAG